MDISPRPHRELRQKTCFDCVGQLAANLPVVHSDFGISSFVFSPKWFGCSDRPWTLNMSPTETKQSRWAENSPRVPGNNLFSSEQQPHQNPRLPGFVGRDWAGCCDSCAGRADIRQAISVREWGRGKEASLVVVGSGGAHAPSQRCPAGRAGFRAPRLMG